MGFSRLGYADDGWEGGGSDDVRQFDAADVDLPASRRGE